MSVAEDAVTALFVPGDRPDRFEKAARSGADVVILDLEDAVIPDRKESALASVVDALRDGLPAIVRINAVGDAHHDADIAALRSADAARPGALLGVMVPKASAQRGLTGLEWVHGRCPVIPLIETAEGVESAGRLARHPDVARIAFGALDFASDVGASEPALFEVVRGALVLASRAARIAAPLESPSPEIDDVASVAADAERARRFGFGGMLCIHPRQIPVVADGFRPTPAEIEWARRVAGTSGVAQIDGSMVDRPLVVRAERILAHAARESS